MAIVWTPTQKRMLAVLSDGLPHSRQEMKDCLDDDLSSINAVWFHVSCMRRKLRENGKDILCQYVRRKFHYRLVKIISK